MRPSRFLGVPWSGVVNLHLQIDASVLRDPAQLLPSVATPALRKSLGSAAGAVNNHASGGWYRGRGLCSHAVEPFVVRGSRQAKFADEVRINELQIKTGRTALMARLNKVPSIRPSLAPRPRRAGFRCALADQGPFTPEANSFYRNPPPDFAMLDVSADHVEARPCQYRG